MADWLLAEISKGLQFLYVLSLDRTPGHDTIRGTALAWYASLTHGRVWSEQHDRTRIEHAFHSLGQTVTRWPAPADLLRALPPSGQLQLAGPESRPADPEYLRKLLHDPATQRITAAELGGLARDVVNAEKHGL